MNVIFSKTALDTLMFQAKYIIEESGNITIGLQFLDEMEHAIKSILSSQPLIGHKALEYGKNTRKWVHNRYTILYHIDNDLIKIDTIFRENLPSI